MDLADRIRSLRKSKGISQEELADQVGVSRQAVSKWESAQSTPDLGKIARMSEFFGVTTDYILKGVDPAAGREADGKGLTGRLLYIASTALVAIGLFCAFGGWYEVQTMTAVWGPMIIQVIGIVGYFMAKTLSKGSSPFWTSWLNVIGVAFMPVSMLTGYLSGSVFKLEGGLAPYPTGIFHTAFFGLVFSAVMIASWLLLKKQAKK